MTGILERAARGVVALLDRRPSADRHLRLRGVVAVALVLVTTLAAAPAIADIPPPPEPPSIAIDGDAISGTTTVSVGATFHVYLRAAFATEFSWELEPLDGKAPVRLDGRSPVRFVHSAGTAGGTDFQVFDFEARAPGTVTLVFRYKRASTKTEPPRQTRQISIQVTS